MKYRLWRRVMK